MNMNMNMKKNMDMNVNMNTKKNFEIKEIIEMVENCDDCTAEDYMNLCELEECGYEIVRWDKNIYSMGCWILEKKEYEVDRNVHDGLFVRLGDRVCEMLDRVCEGKEINKVDVRDRVQDLMYRLCEGLDKWDCTDVIWCLEELERIFVEEKRKRELC